MGQLAAAPPDRSVSAPCGRLGGPSSVVCARSSLRELDSLAAALGLIKTLADGTARSESSGSSGGASLDPSPHGERAWLTAPRSPSVGSAGEPLRPTAEASDAHRSAPHCGEDSSPPRTGLRGCRPRASSDGAQPEVSPHPMRKSSPCPPRFAVTPIQSPSSSPSMAFARRMQWCGRKTARRHESTSPRCDLSRDVGDLISEI
jgi:hypothetical protein